ncbi:MAG: helix-turn-helix transcriptional regulator [Planctomycetota bacterium]|nr:helix-turn-helix transcriptional regulator [Planctomycetota bacterium]
MAEPAQTGSVAAYAVRPQTCVHHTGSGRLDLHKPTPQGRRVKECFIAFLVLEGELLLTDELPSGPETFRVRAGDLHILAPGIPQQSARPSLPGTRMLWSHFSFFQDPSVELLSSAEAAGLLGESDGAPGEADGMRAPVWIVPRHVALGKDLAAVAGLHGELRTYARSHGNYHMGSHMLCGHLIALLHSLYVHRLLHAEDASPRRANVMRACHYIRMNYHKRISLAQVAEALDLSPSYLSRSFKSVMGQGLVEFVIATRLQAAKELLAEQDLISVKEVAYQTGFSSPIYFCRLFRRQERQTPLAYAAKVRKTSRKP